VIGNSRARPNLTDNRRLLDPPTIEGLPRPYDFFRDSRSCSLELLGRDHGVGRSDEIGRSHPSSANTICIGRSSLGRSSWSATSDG
jgi:hypothetical protein